MKISRRDFLKFCGTSAAVLGLTSAELLDLEEALANPATPTVLWLQGASCTGCSVSFLNRISTNGPQTAADILINNINLAYHPNIMSLAGDSAVSQVEKAYNKGGYILMVEGGIPTAFDGQSCIAWSYNGQDVTFKQAVTDLASRASRIICVGNCASYGGVPAAPPNPTGIQSVRAVTGKITINIAGCPIHPDWLTWAIVNCLLGKVITMDPYGRPVMLYNRTIHSVCPRRGKGETSTHGIDGRCLEEIGCKGPSTRCNCSSTLWNGKNNWCVDANAPCLGCTQPDFPRSSLYKP